MRGNSFWSVVVVAFLSLSSPMPCWGDSSTPNIVVIFIDDLGYADVGPFGASSYTTPNLDRMAQAGRKFTDFIVPSAVCSASRAALLTGCLPERIGFRGALGPTAKVGYSTACFGKWHLGRPTEFLPLQHGFDVFYGIPYSNDMWPLHPAAVEAKEKNPNAPPRYPALPMLEGNGIADDEVTAEDQQVMTRDFTRRAVEFIQENKNRPFFLYLPHAMVHVPLYSSSEFEDRSGAGRFGDAVQEIDWSVGEVIKTLQSLDLDENTLVVFTSDNGPWMNYGSHAGSAAPLREGKGTSWEGGIRVPTIMQWPGRIPANSQTDCFASTIDLFPTIASLIGADLPSHKIDGIDVSSILFEENPAGFPDRAIPIYYGNGELQAIRTDRWKLVFPHVYRTLGGRVGREDGNPIPYQNIALKESELYDLNQDVGEQINLFSKFQDPVHADELDLQHAANYLTQTAEQWRVELGDGLQKRTGQAVRPIGQID